MSSAIRVPHAAEAGFTLIEVLVAFSILLVGITGIITAFSAGLALEREGSMTFDAHHLLEELGPTVKSDLMVRTQAGESGDLRLTRRPVPGYPGLEYEVQAMPMPDDVLGHGYLVKIDIIAQRPGGERRTSLDYVPMILAPSTEDLVRRMMSAQNQ
jgi:prepilin-type N-terminal cleavage/methylation domain-containing protein